jgi:ATP synthase protein I
MAKQQGESAANTHMLLILQAFIIALVCAAYAWYGGFASAKAGLFGGLIAFFNSLLLSWHMRRAERVAGDSAERSLRIVYLCAAERLILTIGLLVLGIVVIKLQPLPLVIGFVATQAVVFLGSFKISN